MGGEQSSERRTEEKEEATVKTHQDGSDGQSSVPAAAEENPGELPQVVLGNRKVDDMRFMIACTNWY